MLVLVLLKKKVLFLYLYLNSQLNFPYLVKWNVSE